MREKDGRNQNVGITRRDYSLAIDVIDRMPRVHRIGTHAKKKSESYRDRQFAAEVFGMF
jgi:hypothetical protein